MTSGSDGFGRLCGFRYRSVLCFFLDCFSACGALSRIASDPLHVLFCFAIGRDIVSVFPDCAFARIISGNRQARIVRKQANPDISDSEHRLRYSL